MKSKTIVTLLFLSLVISNCQRDFEALPFYRAPEGQLGSLYEQLAAEERFSTFVSAIDKVPGLKDELSSSGLFTIMAPDNDAFQDFFASHPTFKSIDLIPEDSLALIVKYHIMKWMLFKINFMNPGLTKENFSSYKYESRATLVYKENTASGGQKAIFYPSKMLQVYTPNFLALNYITAQDYTSVYGPGSSLSASSMMNVMGATVTQPDLASGNGVIHVIDKVLVPPPTLTQELEINSEYHEFINLMKERFLSYTYNSAATIAQGNNGDITGDGLVDSLWNRNFDFNAFLDNENPKNASTQALFSLTAFIPQRSVFTNYLNNTLTAGFANDVDSIPDRTLNLLFQSCFSQELYWPSRAYSGNVTNLLGNKIILTQNDVNRIKMTSNGILYELKAVNEPDAFKAVTGPALLSSQYWYFAEMLVKTGLLSSLTKEGTKFTILCPTNQAFQNFGIFYDPSPGSLGPPGFFRTAGTTTSALSVKQLIPLVGNHIIVNQDIPASGLVDGFYPTLNNSIIVIEGGNIHGSVRDTIPQIIDPDNIRSNGYFHGINKTILDPLSSIFVIINSASDWDADPLALVNPQYTKFKELCDAAGILTKDFGSITQVDVDKKFTLFVPSNDAITAAQIAGLLPATGEVVPNTIIDDALKARLESYIRYFFIQNKQALTDGKTTGTFFTAKKDILSTPMNPIYIPAMITNPGGVLTFNEIGTGATGTVTMTDQVLYPQNTIAKDGIIQIIDNAFTSQY